MVTFRMTVCISTGMVVPASWRTLALWQHQQLYRHDNRRPPTATMTSLTNHSSSGKPRRRRPPEADEQIRQGLPNITRSTKPHSETQRLRRSHTPRSGAQIQCEYCAEPGHSTRDCGFRDFVICRQCDQPGHKQKFCSRYNY